MQQKERLSTEGLAYRFKKMQITHLMFNIFKVQETNKQQSLFDTNVVMYIKLQSREKGMDQHNGGL